MPVIRMSCSSFASTIYWFQVFAKHELRLQGIGLEEQRAVDYTLGALMPQGPMNEERPWYNLVHQ